MAGQKKFGAFGGVFTPSILTILGVIMYMRLGWVVGNAGLVGTIAIVLLAHLISISTGLSVSSIATDKKVGAGGIYYILSRSMGIPIGGAIGITLYIGTAFSIALYLIGFAESFNGYFGLDTAINGLRMSGTISLVVLTAIALISTSVALKTQFFILAAIIFSLVSIFMGTHDYAPEVVNQLPVTGAVSLEIVFAIFFPAVTGFTAGIAMSGDLKDPKKSIPSGTIAAIAVGLVVYIILSYFLAINVDTETLRTDYNILMKIALYAPAVVAGIWGATLSSAIGGILGGPRILQAMSVDKVTPKIFGIGKGKNNEPVNALLLVFIIAEAGILIGELDVIARVVSMFYLAAYGFINLSFFLESWANPDFQPTFKVKRWIGLIGFMACFGVMFKLDMVAMFASFIVIGGIYVWLQRKQIQLQSGDVWQSVWENIVTKGLKKLENNDASQSNWNPNIILFGGQSNKRPHLLELGKILSGKMGVVTNFDLVVADPQKSQSIAKTKQTVKDEYLEKLGIFGRRLYVDNLYDGIVNVATTFGFSGIEPNTVMMGWVRTSKNPKKYALMNEQLIHLDYNLLYLDFDEKKKFGNYEKIDLWLRETDSNNAEMMLNIARFVLQSEQWHGARVRVLFVNHNNVDDGILKSKISKLVHTLRFEAEIKIINNGVDQKSFYEIIEQQSLHSDLVLLGIPNIKVEKQAEYILRTDHLFDTIGSTCLVKASNNFNELELNLKEKKVAISKESKVLAPLKLSGNASFDNHILDLDQHFAKLSNDLATPALSTIASFYNQFALEIKNHCDQYFSSITQTTDKHKIKESTNHLLEKIIASSRKLKNKNLPIAQEMLEQSISTISLEQNKYKVRAPKKIKISFDEGSRKPEYIHWRKALEVQDQIEILPKYQEVLYDFGVRNYLILKNIRDTFLEQISLYTDQKYTNEAFLFFKSNIEILIKELQNSSQQLETLTFLRLRKFERESCEVLLKNFQNSAFNKKIKIQKKAINKKAVKEYKVNRDEFASDWLRNQHLFHNDLEDSLYLISINLSLKEINDRIYSQINESFLEPQHKKISYLKDIAYSIKEKLQNNKLNTFDIEDLYKLMDISTQMNLTETLEEREDKIMHISKEQSWDTELITPESMGEFYKIQNDEVESTSFDLIKIQNYLIRTHYLSPMHESVLELEHSFNQISEELNNEANLICYQLEDAINNQAEDILGKKINEITQSCNQLVDKFNEISINFENQLISNYQGIKTELNVRSILSSIDNLTQFSRDKGLNSKLQKWFYRQKKKSENSYHGALDLITQRKQNIESIQFADKHATFINPIQRAIRFDKSCTIDPETSSKLSYYYYKLFSGSHLGRANQQSKSEALVLADNALNLINQGVSGAILVLGDTLSGKTYFTNTIASSKQLASHIYSVNPPKNQKFELNDLHRTMQQLFGLKGTTEAILNNINPGAILVFNDIERWWVKAKNGDKIINYLSKIIEKYGNKHYFLLNSNIHSYYSLRKICNLDTQILSTIIVPPMSKNEMAEIILKRHKVARADLWYNNKPVDDLKITDKLFTDIYSISKGNIGIALNYWISNIHSDDNQFVLKTPQSIVFPEIDDSNWKIILYHLLLHNRLTKYHLNKIFDSDKNKWVMATLQEMEKAQLVYKDNNDAYNLNSVHKYFVEQWLEKLKIV